MFSTDADLDMTVVNVIGLYLIDDGTTIQAIDRQDRALPVSLGRSEPHEA